MGIIAYLKEVVFTKQPVELEGMVVVGYAKAGQNATSNGERNFHGCRGNAGIHKKEMCWLIWHGWSNILSGSGEGIQGKVIVSFVIDKAGRVTDPQVVRSVDQDLDREALRVVKALPDWIPGKQRGVAVDVFYTLPIEFRLQSEQKLLPFREKRMNWCDRPFNSQKNTADKSELCSLPHR